MVSVDSESDPQWKTQDNKNNSIARIQQRVFRHLVELRNSADTVRQRQSKHTDRKTGISVPKVKPHGWDASIVKREWHVSSPKNSTTILKIKSYLEVVDIKKYEKHNLAPCVT